MDWRNFPGFGQSNSPNPGDDPALPPQHVGPYAAQQAGEMRTGVQRDAMMGGVFEEKIVTAIEGVLTSLATAALNEMDKTTQGRQGIRSFQSFLQGQTAPPSPQGQAPLPPAPTHSAPPTPQAPMEDAPQYHPLQAFQEARGKGRDLTMGQVGRAIATPLARYASENSGSQYVMTTDEQGQQVYIEMDPSMATSENPDGVPVDGRRIPVSSAAGMAIGARRVAGANAASFLSGAGPVGKLGMFAARTAGPIGLAIGATQVAGNFFEGQQERATPYRAAFGETGTGGFAAGDRFDEWMTGLSGFGTIGRERAQSQFRAASELGLRGARRDTATDFSGEMYTRFGMDTGESMRIVEQAVQQGNVSLAQFSEAITNVSRAAVDAGRSSAEAIKGFTDAQSYLAENFAPGAAAIGGAETAARIAEGLPTGAAAALGGAKGIAGLVTADSTMQIAAMSGQQPMGAYFRTMRGDEFATADTTAGIGQQIIRMVAGVVGMSADQLTEFIAQRTGGQTVSRDAQYAIILELAGGDENTAGMITQIIISTQNQFGVNPKDGEELNVFFEVASGALGATASQRQAGQQVASSIRSTLSSIGLFSGGGAGGGYEKAAASTSASQSGYAGGFGASSGSSAADRNRSQVLSNINMAIPAEALARGNTQPLPEDSAAFSAYLALVNKTGTGDSTIEALLDPSNARSAAQAAGVSDPGDIKYRIGGKDMSLADAIKSDKYRSQLGDAEIVPASSSDNPVPLVQLELVGDAASVLRQRNGPSDEQRAGTPAPASVSPSGYPAYGGGG